jgi:hypothetical protein
VLLLGIVALGCTSTERETLVEVRGMPITLATTDDRLCVEFGGLDGARSCWSTEDPEQLGLGAADVDGVLVVVVAPPDDGSAVVLTGESFTRSLTVQQTSSGPYFVGVDIPSGTYEIAAEREDGSVVPRSDGVTLSRDSGIAVTITP